jgi:hypothetical protein
MRNSKPIHLEKQLLQGNSTSLAVRCAVFTNPANKWRWKPSLTHNLYYDIQLKAINCEIILSANIDV